jgi:predicted dienelactone hydrolase
MGMSNITNTPVCTVSTHTVRYHTIGSAGEDAEASTALMLPSGSDPACSGPRPVLLYAHGTSPLKSYDMSKLDGTEARMIAAIFAAQGFIVVAPPTTRATPIPSSRTTTPMRRPAISVCKTWPPCATPTTPDWRRHSACGAARDFFRAR